MLWRSIADLVESPEPHRYRSVSERHQRALELDDDDETVRLWLLMQCCCYALRIFVLGQERLALEIVLYETRIGRRLHHSCSPLVGLLLLVIHCCSRLYELRVD